MMRARAVPLLLFLAACTFFTPPESKVRAGELYEASHPKYDPYFHDVHQLQIDSASWDDQRKSARRPLVDALKLDPDVVDVTISQATHERALGVAREAGNVRLDLVNGEPQVNVQNPAKVDEAARTFFSAVTASVKAELDRAKKLREVPPRIEALVKQGHALDPDITNDFSKRGGRVPKQVQDELRASYEVLNDLSKTSRISAREAEDFVADLRRAMGSDIAEAAARPSGPIGGAAKKRPAGAASPGAPPKPEPKAEPKPRAAEPEPAKPKPKAAEPEPAKPKPKEDFNP